MTSGNSSNNHRQASRAIPVSARTAFIITIASVAGLMMFMWPLLVAPPEDFARTSDAPFVFALILPILIAVIAADIHAGVIDTKALAMLGVLSAIGAILRPMGAGLAGIETVFFLLILAGRIYGPGFGFVLGSTTMFASALLTGGVGPWLPFQMMCASWVGLGAGLLPRFKGKFEIPLLVLYGIFAAYLFGFLMNMWSWPFIIGTGTDVSFVPGEAVFDNLKRFFMYTVASSTLGWDTGRAITNTIAILVVGPTMLTVLRRANRKAAFDRNVEFQTASIKVPEMGLGIEAQTATE